MRRLLLPLMAILALLAGLSPGHAQVTADQLNKLSLEALTAAPARPAYRPTYRPTYRPGPRAARHAYASSRFVRPGYRSTHSLLGRSSIPARRGRHTAAGSRLAPHHQYARR